MMYNPFSLEGKVILVTGASSGIGKSIAIECSRLGASVIITGRNGVRLQETFSELATGEHSMFIADLSDFGSLGGICKSIPKLDGLVNCAGLTKTVLYQFLSEELLDQVMNVNFKAPALLTQQLVKSKKLGKGSSVVFVSSISGVNISIIGNSIYSSSKGAINALVKNIALELASKNIRVNSINPGMIDTDILASGEITKEQLEADMKRYPLKRYGKSEEVAHGVIYLLSDASKWITGSNLIIDGGYTLL